MSNEELDNYIKTINPDFNSHIEKGTIEMNNEYYNLLEEKMARLINQNQELKKQLEVGKEQYNDLVEEKESLQEQLSSNTLQLEELKKQLKDKIPYIIQNNLCKYISIEKYKNKVCVNYEIIGDKKNEISLFF